MSDQKKLKVGIIGVGNIGGAHAASIYSGAVEHMTLTALCDSNALIAKRLEELYPDVPVFSDARELMESGAAEAVIIATPHYFHPVLATQAFELGLHVLSEKPIAVDCKSARLMTLAAKESGKVFGVMFNQRSNKLFGEARRIVASGELGELRRAVWIITNWYRKQRYYDSGDWRATWSGEGGGVLLNQAPHNLDLWQWICGMPVSLRAECGVAKYHDVEVEDEACIFAKYENGASGTFITSTGDYPGTNRLEITGSRGKLVLENGKLTRYSFPIDEAEYRLTDETVKNPVTVTVIEDQPKNGHRFILENFARAVLFGEPLLAPGEEAINELSISNAAYLSAWTDKEVSLPCPENEFLSMLNQRKEKSAASNKNVQPHTSESYKDKWNTNW